MIRTKLLRLIENLLRRLRSTKRPKLKPGDRIYVNVLSSDPSSSGRWVLHEFVDFADGPTTCPRCASSVSLPRLAVRSLEGDTKGLLIVVSYDDNDAWKLANPENEGDRE